MSRPLFECLDELKPWLAHAPHLLLGLDYDGTLVPIVDDPAAAVMPRAVKDTLVSLSRKDDLTVTILSGRGRADIQRLVNLPGIIYAGNHGLEISGHGWMFVEPAAASHSKALHELSLVLKEKVRTIPGCQVEDKGLSLAVHYRKVPPENHEEVQHVIHGVLASSSHPYQLEAGNRVYEIRPRVYWNKATAIGLIKDRLGHPDALTIFVGDDVGDEDAFAELPEAVTVKVHDGSVATAASFHVRDCDEVCQFLQWLDDSLQDRGLRAPTPVLS
jgi:trehalose 6-phosphate phosphatase